MDEVFESLIDWIEIPSVTGGEADYGTALERRLAKLGFGTERQELSPGRFNVLARAGLPEVVFCTHLDTVPPYFGSAQDAEYIYGRGACDAKGQAAAMLEAARRLLAAGEERIGFLFTVGEETDSAGAALANAELADPWRPHHVIIGEPTDGRFVAGHKGIYKACLHARGVAGHSSQDVGPSAVHELIRCTQGLLSERWGEDPLFGEGTLNIGQIEGGVAANVVADSASADVLVRTVEEPAVVEARLRSCLSEHVSVEAEYKAYAPVRFHVPEGEEASVVAFGTDAPHLPRWGRPVLIGPGSILDAHTAGEKVSRRELAQVVDTYVRLAEELLARGAGA